MFWIAWGLTAMHFVCWLPWLALLVVCLPLISRGGVIA
jgi:hypothetical protein